MPIFHMLAGILLLTMGRKLFWLFVACLGFVAGFSVAVQIWGQTDLLALALAILLGFLGAMVAIFLQHIAIAVAGFLAGGTIALNFTALAGAVPAQDWLWFLIGGILGAILLSIFFDWALILLSSLVGASILVQYTGLGATADALVFLLLFIGGMIFQARLITPARVRRGVAHRVAHHRV